jgi:hypothetical protein
VERLKSSEARICSQAKAHEAELQELKRRVTEATENFEVEVVKREICEIERSRAQKDVDELRATKKNVMKYSWNALKFKEQLFYGWSLFLRAEIYSWKS